MKPFRERNPVVIGAIGIALIALLLVGGFRAQDLPLIGGGSTYRAEFAEAGGLRANDEVRIAGVRVGKVTDIALVDDHVEVSFTVDSDSAFGTASGAAIRVKTLLGDMFLAVQPVGAGQLEAGSTIPLDRTTSPYDVVQAFEGLADTAGDIDTDQLAASLTTLADLTRDTPEEFRSALQGVSALSTNIADKNDQITTLLQNLQQVSTVLAERDDDIVTLMKDADVLFQALIDRRDDIHRLLISTSTLSTNLTSLVDKSRADLAPALTHLDNVVQVLNKNEDNLDNGLRLLAPFYRVFANTLGTGPWFDTYIQNIPPLPAAGGLG